MRNIFLKIAYDGADYKGWQRQNGCVTVAGEIERTIKDVFDVDVKLVGASRTDAGVHARGQGANFMMPLDIEISRLQNILNGKLPKDIAIVDISVKDNDFNSRFAATGKHYRYIIENGSVRSPFKNRYCLYYPLELDIAAMQHAADFFEGTKDFASLAATSKKDVSTIRTIDRITVTKHDSEIHIDVYGKSFLYKMIRTLAGLMLDVGRGSLTPHDIKNILETKNRANARKTLSGNGLFLMDVYY